RLAHRPAPRGRHRRRDLRHLLGLGPLAAGRYAARARSRGTRCRRMSGRPTLFCFGLGYAAGFLARALAAEGWRIAGTSRDAEACTRLAAQGFDMHVFAPDQLLAAPAVAALASATHLLSSVPPDAAGDPVLAAHGADIAALKR